MLISLPPAAPFLLLFPHLYSQLQKRYLRCVKKFATGFVGGDASDNTSEICLGRFDEFRECVMVSQCGYAHFFSRSMRRVFHKAYWGRGVGYVILLSSIPTWLRMLGGEMNPLPSILGLHICTRFAPPTLLRAIYRGTTAVCASILGIRGFHAL